jgi:OOP family OmpA-OmpF porin
VKLARTAVLLFILIAAPVTHAAEADSPVLYMHISGSRLALQGDVSSTEHEFMLRQTADQQIESLLGKFDLRGVAQTPPGWSLVTELTLRAIAKTHSATATVRTDLVDIQGIRLADSGWQAAIERVEANLLPGMRLQHNVIEIADAGSFRDLCRKQFDNAINGRHYQFASSSHEIPDNMHAMLDAVAEIALDCPDARIEVYGHTDNSGQEPSNVALSQARADEVAAYLATNGVDASRLTATGMGSSQPLGGQSGRTSRLQNRRIEFRMVFEP